MGMFQRGVMETTPSFLSKASIQAYEDIRTLKGGTRENTTETGRATRTKIVTGSVTRGGIIKRVVISFIGLVATIGGCPTAFM